MDRKISILCLAAIFISLFTACTNAEPKDPNYYTEPYRNQFHYSPAANWLNDPNGMVYYEGEYHLFYQYHPNGTKWGMMYWGHAVSKDLIHWEHMPIALSPDKNGQIFSGSAVIDWNNTAGFGKEAMIAIFTHAGGEHGQVQSIAYSLDKGRTWEKYVGNPVMPNSPIPDWRDPKVFWHEDTNQWVMSLAAKDKIMFYTSPDLKVWEYASEFGPDGGIQANSLDRASFALSAQTGGRAFSYEGDITLYEKNGREGTGGLVFRADKHVGQGYIVNLDAKKDLVILSKNVKGINEELAAIPLTISTEKTYHVKVEVDGDHFAVFVDGQAVIEVTDAAYDYGYYGLSAWHSTAGFRNVKFENKSDFRTNVSHWVNVHGEWTETMDGRSGSAAENAVFMSDETGDHFVYTSSVKLTGNEGVGTASLLFRSDADAGNGYYAQLDASGGKVKLLKASKGVMNVLAEKEMAVVPDRLYRIKVDADGSSIKMYVDDKLMLEANDAAFSSGHFGLSFSRVSAVFQDVNRMKTIKTNEKEIANHDFETGDLTGWHAIHGNAFTDDHVSDKAAYWGGPFGQQGSHHLWGFSDLHKGDEAAGELHSSYFRLSGSGEINFLMGGGNDIDNLYVSLVRASDDQELIRQTNTKFNEEKYQQYIWDASRYIGEVLYLKVVDKAAGSWGHLNLDDVRVYNEGPMAEEVDQVASEPVSGQKRLSGVLTDWSAVAGQWIPSTNGSNGGIWECPTLIELPIDGDPNKTKWVLLVSINDGAPAGGSGMQYYVGSFDGTTFTNDNPSDKVLWVDYGADFYAAVDWSDIAGKNGERYWLGWMSNWQYANHTPTSTWRGAMTLPRSMELTDTDEGLRLKQTPVSLESIRDKRAKVSLSNETISGHSSLLSNVSEDTFELIAEFEQTDPKVTEFGFQVRKGAEDYTTVGYDAAYGQLFIDRGNSGAFDFGANVAGRHKGPMNMTNGTVKMHIFVDRSSVEVFGNIGETVITDQIFPDPESNGITIYSEGGEVTLKSLELYPLKSIWSK